jgi:rRNA-processing protein FCF1
MQIASVKVSFPILCLDSLVRHSTPRKPIIFERGLIELCATFSDNPKYNAVPLERIFREILRVPEPDTLVQPSLENLISLGVLRCSVPDPSCLEAVALRDLSLTPAGEEMYRIGVLPARPQDQHVSHLYDPVADKLLGNGKKEFFLEEPGSLSVSGEPFLDAYPKHLIAEQIPREGHPWWNKLGKIMDCELKKSEVRYRNREGQVLLTDTGSIRFEFEEPAHTAYVNHLESATLVNDFLKPVLHGDDGAEWQRALEPAEVQRVLPSAAEFFPVRSIPERLRFGDDGVHFVRHLPAAINVPSTPPSGGLVAFFAAPNAEPQDWIQWNEDRDGAFVYLSDPVFPSGCFYADVNGANVCASTFDLRINDVPHSIPLGYSWNKDQAVQSSHEALQYLEEKLLDHGREDDIVLLLFWQRVENVWQEILTRVTGQCGDLNEAVENLIGYRDRVLQLAGRDALPSWEDDVGNLVAARIDVLPKPIGMEMLGTIISAITNAGLKSKKRLESLFQAILPKVQPPANLEELETMIDMFATFGKTAKIAYPSPLYTDGVVADYVRRFAEPDSIEQHLKERNKLEVVLKRLREEQDRLERIAHRESLVDFDTVNGFQASLKSCDLSKALEHCGTWLKHWCSLEEVVPNLVELASGTELERIHRNVQSYREFLAGLVGKVPGKYRNVYILDTNVFLDRPNILGKFAEQDFIIVAAKVIEELDRHKQNERLREKVVAATNALLHYPEDSNLRFEHADSALLPEDYGKSGDNLILSVALKYKGSNPILLTSDKLLTMKARAEDIETENTVRFIESRMRRTTAGHRTGKTKDKREASAGRGGQ